MQSFSYCCLEGRICRKRAERSKCHERRWRLKGKFSVFHTCSLSRAYSTPTLFLIIREAWINHKSLLYLSRNLCSTNLISCSYFVSFLQFTSQGSLNHVDSKYSKQDYTYQVLHLKSKPFSQLPLRVLKFVCD